MPELPEVQTILSGIAPHIVGRRISQVLLDRPDIVRSGAADMPSGLPGKCVRRIDRHGKRLAFSFDSPAALVIHLGMSGRLTFEPADRELLPHTHLRLRFEGAPGELRFRDPRRFGGVWYFNGSSSGSNGELSTLGPDALSIRVPVLAKIAARRRQIKALLMDQQAISGMGNIYCDEALFAARIHPLTRACKLSNQQIRNLACGIRKTLRAALKAGGSTLRDYRQADGSEGLFQVRHRVYDREGKPCPRCAAKIRRVLSAGRSTHFCPRCQRRRG